MAHPCVRSASVTSMASAAFAGWYDPSSFVRRSAKRPYENERAGAPEAPQSTGPTFKHAKSGTVSVSPAAATACSTTAIASASCGHDTTADPGFTMPAFSPAMAASVVPSSFVWSRPMRAMTAASGASMAFVESRRPPRPTSSTTISQPRRAKCTSATAVISSNSVGWSAIASACPFTSSVASVSSSSVMLAPSTRMRSSNVMRYGLVNSPVRSPAAWRMEARYAQVEPFPFVPATWTNLRRSCGRPSRSSSSRMRSSPSRDSNQRGSLM